MEGGGEWEDGAGDVRFRAISLLEAAALQVFVFVFGCDIPGARASLSVGEEGVSDRESW